MKQFFKEKDFFVFSCFWLHNKYKVDYFGQLSKNKIAKSFQKYSWFVIYIL